MFYTSYFTNTGCEIVGRDLRGSASFRKRLFSKGGYGVCLGVDGCIYVGGVAPGDLYRYNPQTDVLAVFPVSQFGVQYIWDLETAHDGSIYCAAGYPQSRLVRFDPKSETLTDLGEMITGQQYLRSLCVDHRGRVWCGVGTEAHIVVYDPSDGSKRNVLPDKFAHCSNVHGLTALGDRVIASILFDGVLLVFDANTLETVREIPVPEGEQWWMVSEGGTAEDAFVWAFPSRDVYRCRLEDGTLLKIATGVGTSKLVEEGRWIHAMEDQSYVLYDLEKGSVVGKAVLREGGDGMNIFALCSGSDGNIYGSTYINMHMFRCDAETGILDDLGKVSRWSGQVDSLSLGRDGKIYIGAYVRAVLSVLDPKLPIRAGLSSDANPREIGPVGEGQYRTKTNCLGPDGRIYVGSIPDYRSGPTGAFTICDPLTGQMDLRTDFVPGGTVHALVADDVYVYGSGGEEFFVYDPSSDSKCFSERRDVRSLAVAPGGKVIGSGGDTIFVYDRKVNQIVVERDSPTGDFSHMATGTDGRVYGVNKGCLALVCDDGSVAILAEEGGIFAAVDKKGRLYFARGPKLFRFCREEELGHSR